jgi:uncharacterized protein (DUF1800 family)
MAPDETAPQSIPKHVQAMETSLRLIEAAARAAADAPATLADLRPLARALERAIGSTLDAYDLRREPTSALLDAMQACDDAVAALEQATKLDEAMSTVTPWVRAARQWLHVPHAAFASMRTTSPPAESSWWPSPSRRCTAWSGRRSRRRCGSRRPSSRRLCERR